MEAGCSKPEPVDSTRLIIVLVGAPFGLLGSPTPSPPSFLPPALGTGPEGVVTNGALVWVLGGKKYRSSPTLYLAVLAVLDVGICAMYVLIFPVDALAIYHRIHWLWIAWHKLPTSLPPPSLLVSSWEGDRYSMAMYALGRVFHMASTFLVTCAMLERFLLTFNVTRLKRLYSATGRRVPPLSPPAVPNSEEEVTGQAVIGAVLLTAVVLRSPSYFEYRVVALPNCTAPFTGYEFQPHLIQRPAYREIFNFYFINIIQALFPPIFDLFQLPRRVFGLGLPALRTHARPQHRHPPQDEARPPRPRHRTRRPRRRRRLALPHVLRGERPSPLQLPSENEPKSFAGIRSDNLSSSRETRRHDLCLSTHFLLSEP